jgi:ABC-type antimicrobial peptide transport system permease subunit
VRLLRTIFRRRLRASLTILGIAIGVLAVVAMGAAAEKFTAFITGMGAYYRAAKTNPVEALRYE